MGREHTLLYKSFHGIMLQCITIGLAHGSQLNFGVADQLYKSFLGWSPTCIASRGEMTCMELVISPLAITQVSPYLTTW